MDNTEEKLKAHWERFEKRSGLLQFKSRSIYAEIIAQYSNPHRHYHGLRHPALLLDRLDELRHARPALFESRDISFAVELAVWDHDFIWTPLGQGDEERSAAVAYKHARQLNFPDDVGKMTSRYVLATKHAAMPDELGAKIVVDLDLSPLGQPLEDFVRDTADIRREKPHQTEAEFREKQGAFLRGLLKRDRIFSIPYFFNKYERPARANIAHSLQAGLVMA